jgi:DNA helicase HerA-like ATPase
MQLGLIRQFDPHRREEFFTPLEISDERRLQHLFVIGRTGTGKSTALKNFILQDIAAGAGCAFFDPHGDDTLQLLLPVPRAALGRCSTANSIVGAVFAARPARKRLNIASS